MGVRKEISYSLLVGVSAALAFMEINMEVPHNTENRSIT